MLKHPTPYSIAEYLDALRRGDIDAQRVPNAFRGGPAPNFVARDLLEDTLRKMLTEMLGVDAVIAAMMDSLRNREEKPQPRDAGDADVIAQEIILLTVCTQETLLDDFGRNRTPADARRERQYVESLAGLLRHGWPNLIAGLPRPKSPSKP